MSRYEGIAEPGEAGEEGENLESCDPLQYHVPADLTPAFIKTLLGRLLASAYREPHTLSLYVLRKACLLRLLGDVKNVLSREMTLTDVVTPHNGYVRVFGDIHGDIFSLAEGLLLSGLPSASNALVFAGDCVDRGSWGVEVLIALFALKLWQPGAVHLIRGNHESTGAMCRYGFKAEVERKLGTKLYGSFTAVLRQLPCAALVRTLPPPAAAGPAGAAPSAAPGRPSKGKRKTRPVRTRAGTSGPPPTAPFWARALQPGERRVLVAHGGLYRSWSLQTRDKLTIGSLADLANAHRQVDDPMNSVIEDVLWSDPQTNAPGVALNKLRGAGILYGSGACAAFFKSNSLCGLIRGHEGPDMREQRTEMKNMLDGYSIDMELGNGSYVATVFSAADYPMDKPRGNKGCFASLRGRGCGPTQVIPEFTQFSKRFEPKEFELFYDPMSADRPATPRN